MRDKTENTILVIDDHPLFRKGVEDLIAMDENLECIGQASSGEEGIRKAKELGPDIILLDLNMKGMDGIETLKALKAEESVDGRVIMLTVSDHEEDVITALRSGADGYLLKDMDPEHILENIQTAAQGRLVISDRLTELLAKALREDNRPRNPSEAGLTDREREILGLIARGMSNKLIARELDITVGTVKVHIKHLLKKLNLRSRVEAAVLAVSKGVPH
ncbi:two-component system response regulator NarL [Thiohalomonas denitrificans]|uniref:two-component system response regulator NarL n=1 Tax=Thiohalomonas denitrificans TaxID=415747 RepID=UPI0026EACDD9|nr:two-component system response regulator NarL [Thiohalomonas denitrificans]